jgi:hypothetical protein
MENLSTNKRRFIENWRQNVSVFMENGNICRVTVGEVTPEPYGDTTKWQNAENMKALTVSYNPFPPPQYHCSKICQFNCFFVFFIFIN